MADKIDPAIQAFIDAGIDVSFDPSPVKPPSLSSIKLVEKIMTAPTPTVYPSINRWPYRGVCLDLAPGVYLTLNGLEGQTDYFTITDYTVGGMRGREWTVRFDHIDDDFAEFWDEFQMLRAMRKPKPMVAEPATGEWVHGEDGMSTWVPYPKNEEGQADDEATD